MAPKKSHLRLVRGGNKPSRARDPKLAVNRPLIGVVAPEKLDPKKGLRAQDYVPKFATAGEARQYEIETERARKHAQKEHQEQLKGRSRIYPEINVLNSAKGWYRGMIRLARSEGYTDMKKFFKESESVNDHDKRLFDSVTAFIEWENRSNRG